MGIAELGAIGEFVSSIAVLITLVILTLEMRRNSKLLVRANARQTASDGAHALSEVLDERVSGIVRRGCTEGLSVLDPDERYRLDLALCVRLYPLEQAFADYRLGLYPTDHLVGYENAISGFLGSPGGTEWWNERKTWFGPEFRSEVDRLLAAPSGEARFSGPVPVRTRS